MNADLLRLLLGWLDAPEGGEQFWREFGGDAESVLRETVRQGVAPVLWARLNTQAWFACLPQVLRAGLAEEYHQNATRMGRFAHELAAILGAAVQMGVPVIPLKGGLINFGLLPDPAERTMADLDLLIRPEDAAALDEILRELGYAAPPRPRYATARKYVRPNARVLRWEGEHPDNPRAVEVHTNLQRVVWADFTAPDLTQAFWQSARPFTLLGQPVLAPDFAVLHAFLCLHHADHLLFGSARLTHWFDLARPMLLNPAAARGFEGILSPDWVYLPLRLAARALPRTFSLVDLRPLRKRVTPYVARWADSINLAACGLVQLARPGQPRWRERWLRWRPDPLRLALVYGAVPTWWAAGRYALHLLARAGRGWRET
ncbi:MAG: nucleotidyltransferase family protein [Anaerolineales bacterium]